ncbi:MAG: hypothetical protein ABI697_07085 [Devosia sp.]
MAISSIIGALRVSLGLDSAQFTSGLKIAKGDISTFGKFASGSLLALTGVAAGLASALGIATKVAINHADSMGKMAQRAGVTVEALSRLDYAAQLSDVSLEDLTGSLGKLSKTMVDAAQNGSGPTARAFNALGVSVKDASGNLRGSDQVFSDLADRFDRLEDGPTKTALAMTLFGKSGAALIPLLNEGADGLRRYADESDRTGNTISGKAAAGAEKFNDALTSLGQKMSGAINMMVGTDGFQAGLAAISDAITDPKFLDAARDLGELIINGIRDAIPYIQNAVNNLAALRDIFVDFAHMSEKGKQNAIIDVQNQITTLENKITDNKQRLADGGAGTLFGINNAALQAEIDKDIAAVQPLIDKMAELQRALHGEVTPGTGAVAPSTFNFRSVLDKPAPGSGDGSGGGMNLDLFTSGVAKAQEVIDPFAARIAELSDALTATVDPFSQMKLDLTDLKTMFDNGRISAAQFGDAVVKTAAGGIASLADLAGGLTSALSSMFKDNKAIAVANAIVNGIGSVAKTFETYGATPWGFAAAGIAAATAAANVASILSTNENSKSIPGSSGSSGGGAPAAAQSSAINLTIRGGGMISVNDFADQLSRQIADGGNQNLVRVIRES